MFAYLKHFVSDSGGDLTDTRFTGIQEWENLKYSYHEEINGLKNYVWTVLHRY